MASLHTTTPAVFSKHPWRRLRCDKIERSLVDSEGWGRSFLSGDKDEVETPLVTEGVGPESLPKESLDPVTHDRTADLTARGDAEANRSAPICTYIDD